ncbi:hypothetical protein EYS09_14345 [Streptomyces kasugaensis]|uniref:Uncharacterized protein n=1 Tax=Streptomyces kasugaensis TaxID=1946 RepID=A0A4Q9HWT6_STRKA|nr:hypothetical protein [Streptomyces kasugaensis]TBO59019.1 hypothetical protein EYS09_14345 [Streptomyces kasugaensis]
MSEQNDRPTGPVYRKRPADALSTKSKAEQRAAMAAYIADRPQLAGFARDMLSAVEELHTADARSRLAAAGAARKEWKKYEPEVPALILDARDAQMSGADIAADLGMNPSYVWRILREKARYSYRIDVRDDPRVGPGWQDDEYGDGVTDGDDEGAIADPAALAEEIRQGYLGERRAHLTVRISLWKGADIGPDDDAVYAREFPGRFHP